MRRRLFAVILMVAAGFAGAQAQVVDQAVAPLFGGQGSGFAGPIIEDKFHILVIGDTIASGLGDGLARRIEQEPEFELTVRVNEQSGIARPEVYDWKESLPKILEGKQYDAVIVLMGANDRQMIRADLLRFAFNTPDWIAAYKKRVDAVIDALAPSIPKIYWVSVPPMADPAYEEAMQLVEKLQKARVLAKGATYVNIRPYFADPAGKYIEQVQAETGKTQRLRNKNGVNFSRGGNNLLAEIVFDAVKAGGAAAAPNAEAQAPAAPELKTDLPMFGQLDSDGLPTTFRPADLGAVALASAAGSSAVAAGLAALQSLSPPGSAAEQLFVEGEPPPPPPGRVDDFSLPQ